ncbi:MAG: DUF4446 family protein [Actinomycetes bacterium]
MSLTPAATTWVAVSAAAVAFLALVLALVAQIRLRRLRRAYSVLQSGDGESSFVEAAARTSREVDGLRRAVGVLSAGLDDTRADLADAIRHVAVVRYDAFGDMGGRLSFSAALLDDSGDGLVLSSIAGRTETRTYAKGVKRGTSEAQLSPEEEQVVGWALRGRGGGSKPPAKSPAKAPAKAATKPSPKSPEKPPAPAPPTAPAPAPAPARDGAPATGPDEESA